jgi:CRP-like cAMP-binding protein
MNTLATLTQMERIVYLKHVSLFANLPPADLKRLSDIAQESFFTDGDVIAGQGEPGDEMTIIVSGQIRVMSKQGSESRTLAVRGPGDVVGEMSIISQEPRMATLVAAGDVRLLTIEQKQFEGILRERPETRLAVLRMLCERLKEVS